MSSTATIRSEHGHAGIGRVGSGHRRPALCAAGDPMPNAAGWRVAGAPATAWTQGEMPSDSGGRGSRSEREQQQRRNAEARRKLEARREQELLRRQLSEPWDEIGNA